MRGTIEPHTSVIDFAHYRGSGARRRNPRS